MASKLWIIGSPGAQSGSVKDPGLDMILSKYFLEFVKYRIHWFVVKLYHFARPSESPFMAAGC